MFSNKTRIKCPATGCNKEILKSDLTFDHETKVYVDQHLKEEEKKKKSQSIGSLDVEEDEEEEEEEDEDEEEEENIFQN